MNPHRKRPNVGCWLLLAITLCTSPLDAVLLFALSPLWAILIVVTLLFLLIVVGLMGWPARTARNAHEEESKGRAAHA